MEGETKAYNPYIAPQAATAAAPVFLCQSERAYSLLAVG